MERRRALSPEQLQAILAKGRPAQSGPQPSTGREPETWPRPMSGDLHNTAPKAAAMIGSERGSYPQGYRVPKPSSICCLCASPLSFSADKKKSDYERKWNVHWKCRGLAVLRLDQEGGA